MESIKELREICQNTRLWADTWHGRNICRPLSIYITRLVLFTPLTANHVTMIFFVAGLAGALLFLNGSRMFNFIAAIMLQLWYLLDHVDGEVARYRKTTSLAGIYMDEMVHYIVHPLIFICMGIGQFFLYGQSVFIFACIMAAAAMIFIPLSQQVKEKVFKKGSSPVSDDKKCDEAKGKRLFSILHKSCTFPAVMNIITALTFISLFIKIDLAPFILWYYAVIGTLVWSMRIAAVIVSGKQGLDES